MAQSLSNALSSPALTPCPEMWTPYRQQQSKQINGNDNLAAIWTVQGQRPSWKLHRAVLMRSPQLLPAPPPPLLLHGPVMSHEWKKCHRTQKHSLNPGIKVPVISGFTELQYKSSGANLEAARLQKPFTTEDTVMHTLSAPEIVDKEPGGNVLPPESIMLRQSIYYTVSALSKTLQSRKVLGTHGTRHGRLKLTSNNSPDITQL
ncbi:hypothetical protein STEG23_036940, partial [Scotinomys teguina]